MEEEREKGKNRNSWLPWVLGLAGLALIALLALPLTNDTNRGPDGLPQVGIGGGPQTSPITDINSVVNEPNEENLVNRPIQLNSVRVLAVASDKLFVVGSNPTEALLVSIPEGSNVEPGQTVNITGTLQRIPPPNDIIQMWNLTQEQADALQGEIVYLQATNISVQ